MEMLQTIRSNILSILADRVGKPVAAPAPAEMKTAAAQAGPVTAQAQAQTDISHTNMLPFDRHVVNVKNAETAAVVGRFIRDVLGINVQVITQHDTQDQALAKMRMVVSPKDAASKLDQLSLDAYRSATAGRAARASAIIQCQIQKDIAEGKLSVRGRDGRYHTPKLESVDMREESSGFDEEYMNIVMNENTSGNWIIVTNLILPEQHARHFRHYHVHEEAAEFSGEIISNAVRGHASVYGERCMSQFRAYMYMQEDHRGMQIINALLRGASPRDIVSGTVIRGFGALKPRNTTENECYKLMQQDEAERAREDRAVKGKMPAKTYHATARFKIDDGTGPRVIEESYIVDPKSGRRQNLRRFERNVGPKEAGFMSMFERDGKALVREYTYTPASALGAAVPGSRFMSATSLGHAITSAAHVERRIKRAHAQASHFSDTFHMIQKMVPPSYVGQA